jgi:hypothetical protein
MDLNAWIQRSYLLLIRLRVARYRRDEYGVM